MNTFDSDPPEEQGPTSNAFSIRYQRFLDRTAPHIKWRWALTFFLFITYCVRVYLLQGWFVVTYALGIYLLNLFLGFLSPLDDPDVTGPVLPTHSDEFRPFARRLPEFSFWLRSTQALLLALTATLFEFFDIPVFWPILLLYFCMLFFLTMKRQIKHMIKHRYLPFSWGKQRYGDSDAK
eukprot:c2864_g1_i1.p1 GENE.c2864_g1_i1~~c2864_g1_i1.p1  ORF type:complete len:192 (+),score=33.19 c2864_g1_i1:41-577(+)